MIVKENPFVSTNLIAHENRITMYEDNRDNFLNRSSHNNVPKPFGRPPRESEIVPIPSGMIKENQIKYYQEALKSIPSANKVQRSSNYVAPDSNHDVYLRDKKIEQMSISYQTYRTLPIVSPKPKTYHDLATGCYMRYNQDPTWDLIKHSSRPTDHQYKIQQGLPKLGHGVTYSQGARVQQACENVSKS